MTRRAKAGLLVASVSLLAAGVYVTAARETGRAAVGHGGRGQANRLALESSPYLLQHAYNPVDWYPWGDEAFERAREEDKPIFLSVGYSTCHWCHVMEHESFSNAEIARLMNEHFVCIKLDREERPDIDGVYMGYVQAVTGRGGWPMSVWMTPDRKPFMGGTYFPPDAFTDILTRLSSMWQGDRQRILDAADSAAAALQRRAGPSAVSTETPGADLLHRGYRGLEGMYDAELGGFGGAPKFPRPVTFAFLLRYDRAFEKPKAVAMTLHTLRAMARGGMYDHLGDGFHRYSTDERWHVPHFEKMLYDQAQLAVAYIEAYQRSGEPSFAGTARGILRYVLRDMTHPDGGFYSAEDADSAPSAERPREKLEGAFYVWTAEEILAGLGAGRAELFNAAYGVRDGGNVAPGEDPRGELEGKNVLYAAATPADLAKRFGRTEEDIERELAGARTELLAIRSKRVRPHLDDKVLAAWNGLMISAFARAAWALPGNEGPSYLDAATRAARFVGEHLLDEGRATVLRRYREGNAAIGGFIEDYAFFIQGLLDLYEAGGGYRWLDWALRLQETQDRLFWDDRDGGYFSSDGKDDTVLTRQKEAYDGAEPAGNSVAAMNLLRMGSMTGRKALIRRAEELMRWAGGLIHGGPHAQPLLLAALAVHRGAHRQLVLAGDPGSPGVKAMRAAAGRRFLPDAVVLFADGGPGQRALADDLEFLGSVKPLDGNAAAYVCVEYVCERPTTDPAVMVEQLDRTVPGAP